VQPQKSLPALDPRLAVRRAIGFAHIGHEGASCNRDGVGSDAACTCPATDLSDVAEPEAAPRTRRISACSAGPSMSDTLRLSANAAASSVKRPDVTTKPPVAPRAAITP